LSNEIYIKKWRDLYKSAPEQLAKMSKVKGLISAFNANIDAVIKISGKKIESLLSHESFQADRMIMGGPSVINSKEDALRGILKCFTGGIAEEWLIEDESVYHWLNENIGFDQLQMGGQGGIVANAMAVCGVDPVYVHCASLPEIQGKLFLDLPNLLSVDENGEFNKAYDISRDDLPLIHWIIEFDKGDTLQLNGKTITCPKSNRFIATYDPLNFILAIDQPFADKFLKNDAPFEYIILSGYQMLQENPEDGVKGLNRIDDSIKIVNQWKQGNTNHILHFEIASTQDKVIRKRLLDALATESDSIGFNERELIDMLEVIGEEELAALCDKETTSANLFKGMLKVYEYTHCPRLQLHMFGLYITLQKKGFQITPEQNRNGMQLAAVIAAAKAGTGAINSKDVLLWAENKEVSSIGISELQLLSEEVNNLIGQNDLVSTGIFSNDLIEIIAVPTIIIDNPVTLVGMGDTISSISLVGAR
jgi:ADP-dependent phosphofructokinase/glucokinase